MDDQVHEENWFRGSEGPGTPPPDARSDSGSGSANSWFSNEPVQHERNAQGREPAPAPSAPGSAEQTPEQRYADALAALNQMIATLDFTRLPRVTEVLRATAGALPESDPSRPSVLNNLGSTSQLAHLSTGDLAHLEDAVAYYRSAADTAARGDPEVVLYLCNLALALSDCAGRTDSAEQAAEAVSAARRATRRTETEHEHRTTALIRLGNALKLHARLAADTDSDDESVDVFRAAVQAALGADGGQRAEGPELIISLGSALLRRHERTAGSEDLDEGIKHLGSGVGMLPDGEYRRSCLLRFAEALRLRYRQRGDLADLQSAINELFGVLEELEPGNLLLGKVIWNLTSATVEHTDSSGEPANLHRALRLVSPAMRALAGDDPHRAVALAAYGALARRTYMHGGHAASLDTAVSAGEAAVEAAIDGARYCAVLNSLASTLITRHEYSGDGTDLDNAARTAQRALDNSSRRTAPQYTAYAQLGVIAAHRYRFNADTGELERAVEMFDRALIAMPESAPERVAVSTHLGRALQTLYRRSGRRKHYRWARKTLTEAATQATGPVDQRLRAANLCGRLAARAHRWSEALESFTIAVELLPLVTQGKRAVAAPGTQRRWAHVTADAAACALEVGRPERAVELLEHGRQALTSELLPAGGELGQLYEEHPELATEAIRVRRLLDRPADEPILAGPDILDEVDRRVWLAETWDELVSEVRATSEHEQHLHPRSFAELAEGLTDGAVVLVNLSRFRCDALIVFAGRALIVPLQAVSAELASEHAETMLTAAEKARRSERDERDMHETLDWLWHNITRPVLDRMGYTRTPAEGARWPRVWWSTVGSPAFLPLHAATSRTGESALDRVISSYTPGLRVLRDARNHPRPDDSAKALIVGTADRTALDPAEATPARCWPSASVTAEQDSTAEDIAAILRDYSFVHVTEPSTQNAAQPAAGSVLDRESQGRSLSLVELGQVEFSDSEFFYLGRCGTREIPTAAALTLASALAFAGVTHVISTLWSLDRETAAEMLHTVYENLSAEGGFDTDASAVAVHTAAQRIRELHPGGAARWAGMTHVGP